MQKRWWTVVNAFVLIVVILALSWIVWNFSFKESASVSEECVDVNRMAGFVYDMCYDSYTKNIFMLMRKSSNDYELDSFDISFSDVEERNYNLKYDIVNDYQLYDFYAERNPGVVDLILNVVENFSEPICETPRKLFVRNCLTKSPGWGGNFLDGSEVEGDILLGGSRVEEYPSFVNISEKEIVWKLLCESDWKCFEWESCDGDLQRRSCNDRNECFIPTDIPKTVKYCGAECIESWECNWSDCIDGFTTPTCEDKNECGSSYNLPSKMSCFFDIGCRPFIRCDEWSSCEIDYNLLNLSKDNIREVAGVKSRVCRDLALCVEPARETMSCSTGVDIYTKRLRECGIEFVGVYNKLDSSLIARIDEGSEDSSYLNIYLGGMEGGICDYCVNGIMDGDEEGVDCGGSCGDCEESFLDADFEKENWWLKFDWIRGLFYR